MTKAEELKLLEKIEELLRTSDANSYIASTFAGVTEVCRNNIINDFGDEPVRDLSELRERFDAERRMHEQTKKDFSEYRASTDKVIDDMDKELTAWKQKYSDMSGIADRNAESADEWEKNAHDAGELYCELEKECAEKDAEIMRLKAEIYDLRKECGK